MSNNSSSLESYVATNAPLPQPPDAVLQQAAAMLVRISNNVGRVVIGRSRGIELLLVGSDHPGRRRRDVESLMENCLHAKPEAASA
jgi:hypothetical protein